VTQPYPQQPQQPYQQPYPQQAYPAPAGGRLVVSSSYNPLSFMLAVTGPKIEVNGHPIQAKWGEWPIDLPAGNHMVRVSTRYLGEFGPAQLGVTVYPGQQVTVYYRAPAAIGMGGAIGFHPQKTRGMTVVMGISVLMFVLAMVVLFAAL